MNTRRYMGYITSAAGGAGIESFGELWVPSTESFYVRLNKIILVTADVQVKFKYHTSQQGSAGSGAVRGNKDLGGPLPTTQFYGHALASVSGTNVMFPGVVADVVNIFDWYDSPIIIKAGQSFIVENVTANTALTSLICEWDEVGY